MRKYFLLIVLCISSYANQTHLNIKNCETIKLSKFTILISCHKFDYLIEYRHIDDEEKDNIKKITLITPKIQKVIKQIGK